MKVHDRYRRPIGLPVEMTLYEIPESIIRNLSMTDQLPKGTGRGWTTMTKDQAAALQAEWKKQIDPLPCEHITLELENNTATGYLTRAYYCITCGESIPRP
jgi:hypothetical protein